MIFLIFFHAGYPSETTTKKKCSFYFKIFVCQKPKKNEFERSVDSHSHLNCYKNLIWKRRSKTERRNEFVYQMFWHFCVTILCLLVFPFAYEIRNNFDFCHLFVKRYPCLSHTLEFRKKIFHKLYGNFKRVRIWCFLALNRELIEMENVNQETNVNRHMQCSHRCCCV